MKLLLSNPWVGLVAAVALFGGGLWAGHSWRDNTCLGDSVAQQTAATEAAAEIATLRKANAEYEELIAGRNKDVEANKALAGQRDKEAEAASSRVRELERQLLIKDQQWKKKFADAMGDPKCAELMEMQVCEAAPLP